MFKGIFTPEQHLRFLEFYKKLCTLGLEQENGHNDNQIQLQTLEQEKKYISVRKNCAYNLPVSEMLFYLSIISIKHRSCETLSDFKERLFPLRTVFSGTEPFTV